MSAIPNGPPGRRGGRARHIRFPGVSSKLEQDEEWFEFDVDGRTRRLRIHDYAQIYRVPGLYETLVYDKLQCNSPRRVADLLASVLSDRPDDMTRLRVLDLGAGNGVVGEELRALGVGTVVGLDLLPEAAAAARRDRPGVYTDYVVTDLRELDPRSRHRLEEADLNCLITVAALGFGDVPPKAFATAFNLIAEHGWVGMTIKEDFLQPGGDDSGFARLMRELVDLGIVDIQAHLRFCHRLSIKGERLFYLAIVARKGGHIPPSLLRRLAGGAESETKSRSRSNAAAILVGGAGSKGHD